jgi:hypothetical protein
MAHKAGSMVFEWQFPLTTDINNNNVRPNLLNIFIRDYIVWLIVKEIKKFVSARNNQRAYLSAAFIEFQIAHFSQAFTIFQVDDRFALQFGK